MINIQIISTTKVMVINYKKLLIEVKSVILVVFIVIGPEWLRIGKPSI